MYSSQSVINELNSVVDSFVSKVDVKIDNVNTATTVIRQTSDSVYDKINTFKSKMILNEQKQTAHESVLRLDQIIREQFSDYIQIRKTIIGVVKDFDINLVRNKTIAELSEELWISSSRYWLSYALIAISAWASDNKELGYNAVDEAARHDEIKTTLFFCLTNLRFGRLDIAKKWLTAYFSVVVPNEIQPETAVLLQAYINGIFGANEEIQQKVQKVVNSWIDEMSQSEEVNVQLIDSFTNYIQNINPGAAMEYEDLHKICENYDNITYSYLESYKFERMMGLIKTVDVEAELQKASNYKNRIDKILYDLISNYDKEEMDVREQKEFYELILKNEGDIDISKTQHEEILNVRHQKVNIGSKLVDWALYKNNDEINPQVRKFGFQNTKTWFIGAVDKWSQDVETKFPTNYSLKINSWTSKTDGEDNASQIDSLKEYLERNKFKIKFVNKLNIFFLIMCALTLIAGILMPPYVGNGVGSIICYVLSVAFLILLGVRVFTAGNKFNEMVKIQIDMLTAGLAQLTQLKKIYKDNMDLKSTLLSNIEQL